MANKNPPPLKIGFLVFEQMTQLDMTGPAQVLSRLPNCEMHYLSENLEPVMTDSGFAIVPTTTYRQCPQLDILVVTGGIGVFRLNQDKETLSFLKSQGDNAQYVCSVCNGSLVLGAAGLLGGYKSACHWAWGHELAQYGAEFIKERVVEDRNRISGGGVTAGIDFGLSLYAKIAGVEAAKMVQLGLEYDPAPPFDCGSPEKAGRARVDIVLANNIKRIAAFSEKYLRSTS
jgi:cyclohexyl-isocyanide hydratase